MNNYLMHFGIKGQQWGVRRYQNEDGTLTEEGKRRYLDDYDAKIRKADADIKRAENQISDIEKNGWNAKSAFTKQFVKDLKKGGALDDYHLETFKNTFKEDLSTAKANKKYAESAKDFISSANGIKVEDIADFANKKYKKSSGLDDYDYKEDVEKLADDMGISYNKKYESTYDKKLEKELKDSYSKNDMKEIINSIENDMKKSLGKSLNDSIVVDGKKFSELPVERQFYVLYMLFMKDK